MLLGRGGASGAAAVPLGQRKLASIFCRKSLLAPYPQNFPLRGPRTGGSASRTAAPPNLGCPFPNLIPVGREGELPPGVDLASNEEFEEFARCANQVGFRLGTYESGIGHDGFVVGVIQGVDEEVHLFGVDMARSQEDYDCSEHPNATLAPLALCRLSAKHGNQLAHYRAATERLGSAHQKC